MTVSTLQKIVVLCAVLVIAGGAYALYQNKAHAPAPESDLVEQTPAQGPASTSPETDSGEQSSDLNEETEQSPVDDVVCAADVRECPDGSFVNRVAPSCEFAACPSKTAAADVTVCTDEMKAAEFCTMEYAPVCGLVQVQCITTPCDPIPETFSNGCSACSQSNVLSYTAGACSAG